MASRPARSGRGAQGERGERAEQQQGRQRLREEGAAHGPEERAEGQEPRRRGGAPPAGAEAPRHGEEQSRQRGGDDQIEAAQHEADDEALRHGVEAQRAGEAMPQPDPGQRRDGLARPILAVVAVVHAGNLDQRAARRQGESAVQAHRLRRGEHGLFIRRVGVAGHREEVEAENDRKCGPGAGADQSSRHEAHSNGGGSESQDRRGRRRLRQRRWSPAVRAPAGRNGRRRGAGECAVPRSATAAPSPPRPGCCWFRCRGRRR